MINSINSIYFSLEFLQIGFSDILVSAPSFVRPLSSLGLVKNVTQSAETLCNKHVFLQKDIHCSTVQFCFLLFPVFAPYKVVIFEPFHILFEFELRIYTILFGYNICPIMLVTIWWYFKTIATLKYEDGKVQTGTAVDAANCRGSPYSSPPPPGQIKTKVPMFSMRRHIGQDGALDETRTAERWVESSCAHARLSK